VREQKKKKTLSGISRGGPKKEEGGRALWKIINIPQERDFSSFVAQQLASVDINITWQPYELRCELARSRLSGTPRC